MVPMDVQEAAQTGAYTHTLFQEAEQKELPAILLAGGGALLQPAVHQGSSSQLAFGGSQPLGLGSQPDLLGSQPGTFGASQPGTGLLLPGSQDSLPGGWDGLGIAYRVKTEQLDEHSCGGQQGVQHAGHARDPGWQEEANLKLESDEEAELERYLEHMQLQHWSQESHQPCQQQQERQYRPLETAMPAPQVQMKPVHQPGVPGWVPQTVQQSADYAALEQKLQQIFYAHPATAQQEQQPQQSGEEPPAGCGGDHLLLSPPAPVAPISGKDFGPATVQPPAAGSRKRKALQPADSPLPTAKRATHAPAQQAAAAAVQVAGARSKGSSDGRQPARRSGSSGAHGSKSVVCSTARRAIAKKPSQKRTPGQQPLQSEALVAAAASTAAAAPVQQAQQAQPGSAAAAQQQRGKQPASKKQKQQASAAAKPQLAKIAPKKQQQAPKAVVGKQASKACGSGAAAGSCKVGGSKAAVSGSSKPAVSGSSKPAAGSKGKTAASGSSIEASSSQVKCGKRVRVSRPCTGNQTGRRKGGMNVPPEKLFAYHMDLLGKGGKQKLAEEHQTRTDSMAAKVQSFLRGLIDPEGEMRLTDDTLISQTGKAETRHPSLSLDKQRLLREGITDFGKFSVKYVEPNPNAKNRATTSAEGQRSNQRLRRPRQA